MAHRQHIEVQVHTRAKADAVYALLRDGTSWPRWTSIDSFELERAGEREPEGLGAIRIFRKGTVAGRDSLARFVLAEGAGDRLGVAVGDRAIRHAVRARSGWLCANRHGR